MCTRRLVPLAIFVPRSSSLYPSYFLKPGNPCMPTAGGLLIQALSSLPSAPLSSPGPPSLSNSQFSPGAISNYPSLSFPRTCHHGRHHFITFLLSNSIYIFTPASSPLFITVLLPLLSRVPSRRNLSLLIRNINSGRLASSTSRCHKLNPNFGVHAGNVIDMSPLRITATGFFNLHRNIFLRFFTTPTPTTPPPHTTITNPITPVNQSHLLRVCTILYQQQHSPFLKLQTHLQKTEFNLTHEFFLQVCNKFPLSWRPVYLFYQFTLTRPDFSHTSTSFNKILDVMGKARNIDLFWEFLNDIARRRLVTDRTCRIATRTLGGARELKKSVEFFQLLDSNGFPYSLETLNKAVESLCRDKLVDEAKHIVFKLKDLIVPDGCTYKHLICGFCDSGDVIEASKLWNLLVDEGFEADMDVVNKMIETFFKKNQLDQALKLFQVTRVKRMDELGLSTYSLVIDWLCKKGKLSQARQVFDEMLERGIQPDDEIIASLVYGLVSKRRVREAYLMVEKLERPSINVYHGLIKGFLRVKSAGEATEVFREMIRRGCEPTMHTYIMLLQAHLGKRGRKGRDPLVNFDTIFVGGLVKAGKSLEATKYVERILNGGTEVPRFDYNRFLQYYSNEEGVVMFEEGGKKLREVGLFDLADVLARYGEKMATRDRRRDRECINK